LRQTIFKPQSNKQTIQARPTRTSTINSNNVLPFPHLKVRADAFPFFNPVLALDPNLVHGHTPSTLSDHFSSNSELWTQSSPFPSVSPPLLSGSTAKRRKRERALSSPRRVWVAGLGWLGILSGERLRGRRLAQVLAQRSESLLLLDTCRRIKSKRREAPLGAEAPER
jgi:hypothetical protein